MIFKVVTSIASPAEPGDVLLVKNDWNDWFVWETQFSAAVVRVDGSHVSIGDVKIACVGMTHQKASTNLPDHFSALPGDWFSIGQSENYYETLNEFGAEYRSQFLQALRDCAFDPTTLNQHLDEIVLKESLLRSVDLGRVRNRFYRLAHGNAGLTPFAFRFSFPSDQHSPDPTPTLSFHVTPNSNPPSNVHVLIGRNGVGKTRCFNLLSRTFLGLSASDGTSAGQIEALERRPFQTGDNHGFAGLVTVSFSPFDVHGPLVSAGQMNHLRVRYKYVGLIGETASPSPQEDSTELTIKSRHELIEDFVSSVEACRRGARRSRWERALSTLEADPLFEEANVAAVAAKETTDWEGRARSLFQRLSSGHSIVLLTITRLVELIEEKTLVLIDEPEGHLHPPLLSAFVRALTDLLIDRNGVAIIATHSPVVLQEVPKDCVWILNRSGYCLRIERPEHETFGENIGFLTREVFGLEVIQSGFHRRIAEAVDGRTYDEVLQLFENRLGGEARALARVLTLMPSEQSEPEEDQI